MAVRGGRQIMIGSRLTQYELILNGWNMKFWKFGILETCPGPIFKFLQKNGFENAPLLVLQIPPRKLGLENRATPKIQISTFSRS